MLSFYGKKGFTKKTSVASDKRRGLPLLVVDQMRASASVWWQNEDEASPSPAFKGLVDSTKTSLKELKLAQFIQLGCLLCCLSPSRGVKPRLQT